MSKLERVAKCLVMVMAAAKPCEPMLVGFSLVRLARSADVRGGGRWQ